MGEPTLFIMTYHQLGTIGQRLVHLVAVLFLFATPSFLRAQGVVDSGLTGIVRNASGAPVSGATIVATHEPTGTRYTATTGATGRYNFRGLIVGGPYTVTATSDGSTLASASGVTTQLGSEVDVNLAPPAAGEEVITLDRFTVDGDVLALDSGATGAGSVLTSQRIQLQPTSQRSFQDMARTNAFVTFRQSVTDRLEQQITAVGQNNRYNSVMLDGARINDQFGLNGSGLQSFFNPISLETIEQFSVSVSPYDARQSGFTGAAINAVTKSGTNRFSGSAYTYYTDQDLAGEDEFGATSGTKPLDEQKTYGFTLGGPLWPNRLFFFANFEKFERTTAASQAGFVPASSELSAINARLTQITGFDFGTFGGPGGLVTEDEKRLLKIDWNITSDHRLSLRYNDTKGSLPQFGRFSTTATLNGLGQGGLSAPRGTALSSNFYTQERTEEVWAGSIQSQWTSDLKTEFKYSNTSYEQLTTSPIAFPEIRIFGVNGTFGSATVPNGFVALGTEQFRHGNVIQVDTSSYSGNADYFWRDFTFTAGFDREESEFYNLFRQGSYGLFDYASVADFVADAPRAFTRSFYVQGTPAADISEFAITGFFGQAKWDISPRLNATLGLRLDTVESDTRPTFNQRFSDAFGIRNDGNVDGAQSVSPRLGFNYSVDDDRTAQIRGGIGHFQGRAPWVFVSNAYGNTGVGRFNSNTIPTGNLTGYLASGFDRANPIGVAATDLDPNARREVNLLEDELELPSVWRGNLAAETKLPILGLTASVEWVQTHTDKALFTDNLNIRPSGAPAADGRIRFAGSATSPGAVSTAFGNVIRVRNIEEGRSSYVTFMLDRPMTNRWSANFSYTRGRSVEAQSFGQTVAVDGWSRNAVFNQNTVELSRSDFEVRDRVQLTLGKMWAWKKGWETTTSLYYEGRTGNPYSFAYSNDLNGDGTSGNDLVYVPNGAGDPVMDFSAMPAAQRDALLAFVDNSELRDYKGKYAPRNAFTQPWQNRLDIRLAQRIPIYSPAELEIFVDFINFGYWLSRDTFGFVEELGNNNGVFARRLLGSAAYTADGKIAPTYTATPADATINNLASRWRFQFGARLKF